MEQKTKTERFADFINAMSFSEVIKFFNFMMEDMMQEENHAMYDYTIQEDAEKILSAIGIFRFLEVVNCNTEEERAVMYSVDQNGILNYEWKLNPWTEILDGYSNWIISHIEDCIKGNKDISFIKESYPQLIDVLSVPKKKFRFAIHCTLTKIVTREGYDIDSVQRQLEEDVAVEGCDSFETEEYQVERLQD